MPASGAVIMVLSSTTRTPLSTCVIGFRRGSGARLVAAEPRAVLAVEEVADAFAAPRVVLTQRQLVGLCRREIERGFAGHLQREAVAVLAGRECIGILGGDLFRELRDLLLQIGQRKGF